MQGRIIGQVKRVNGPVLQVKGITDAAMMELVHVGEGQIVGEIVKLSGTTATVQVYEDATGIAPGDNVYGSGMSLSCELGPGLIGNIYDGIQRPLEELRRLSGDFIGKGISASAVDEKRLWHFTPVASVGDTLSRGDVIGEVDETSRVKHRIMVPSSLEGEWTLISIVDEGDYDVRHEIAVIEQEGLVVEPVAEVTAQQGQHPVLGPDLPGQHPLELREADEALEQMHLPVQVTNRLEKGQHGVVAEAAEERPAHAVEGPDEAVEDHLPVRGAGEEALHHQLLGPGVDLLQAHQDPLGVAQIGAHPAGGEEGGDQMGLVLKLRRTLPVYITVKYAAEEPLKAAVIAVDDFHRSVPPSRRFPHTLPRRSH